MSDWLYYIYFITQKRKKKNKKKKQQQEQPRKIVLRNMKFGLVSVVNWGLEGFAKRKLKMKYCL